MGYISESNLIANMDVEQKILVQQVYAKFDIGSGLLNKKIVDIQPLMYYGNIGGSIFNGYSATKLFICFNLEVSGVAMGTPVNPLLLQTYDELNNNLMSFMNSYPFWDATAVALKYVGNNIKIKNIWFSTFSGNIVQCHFIGYKITLGTV